LVTGVTGAGFEEAGGVTGVLGAAGTLPVSVGAGGVAVLGAVAAGVTGAGAAEVAGGAGAGAWASCVGVAAGPGFGPPSCSAA
jgi:hypothetical protein